MAFLTLNGWDVPVSDGNAGVRFQQLGAVSRSYMGKLSGTRRAKVREWSCKTVLTAEADAVALEGLINGDGHVWSFDNDLYSSKGLGPLAGYSVTVSAAGGRFLGHVEVGSGTNLSFNPVYDLVEYTLLVWKKEGGVWYNYGIDDAGNQYENGATHTPIGADDVTNWFTFSSGNFILHGKDLAGVNAAAPYDDLVIVPYRMPLAQIAAIYGLGAAHSSLPEISASGDVMPQTSATVIGELSEASFVQAMTGSGFASNVRALNFVLREVRQAGTV
jgi:hypothetical protein